MIQPIVKVEGMICGMCEAHVNDAIRKAVPAKNVTSSHTKGEALILTEEKPEAETSRRAIKSIGYTVTDITSSPYEKKGVWSLFR